LGFASADANVDGADANGSWPPAFASVAKALKTKDVDATDAKHANFSTQSGPEKEGMPRLDRCAQCNGPEADAPLTRGEGYPPGGVHLHPECRRFWLAARASPCTSTAHPGSSGPKCPIRQTIPQAAGSVAGSGRGNGGHLNAP
jgi:hypothetical protein